MFKMAFGKRGLESPKRSIVVPPHWMKQMEEKCHRLHAKIHSQTMKYTSRRHKGTSTTKMTTSRRPKVTGGEGRGEVNKDSFHGACASSQHSSGDSAIETMFEEFTSVTTGNRAVTSASGGNPYRSKSTNTGEFLEGSAEVSLLCRGDTAKVNTCIDQDLTVFDLQTQRILTGDQIIGCDPSSASYIDIGVGQSIIKSISTESARELSDETLTIQSDGIGELVNSVKSASRDESDEDMEFVGKSRSRRRRRDVRPIKTPASRLSNITSHSCSASIYIPFEGQDYFNYNSRNNGRDNYNNGKELMKDYNVNLNLDSGNRNENKIFAQMSKEARHAVEEMMAELEVHKFQGCNDVMDNASSSHKVLSSNDGLLTTQSSHLSLTQRTQDDCYKEDNTFISKDSHHSPTAADTNRSHTQVKNRASKTSELCDSEIGELRQAAHYPGAKRGVNRKLPHLTQGVTLREEFPNPHRPLPDIRRTSEMLSFRENTFEITPVDFDIRFHQIITYNHGDSPPPDIRQQSIEKCQHWLVRHTPRR